MLDAGYRKSEIARTIGVSKSTVTREVSRNADGRSGAYRHALAQRKAEERKRSKSHAVALTPEAKAYLEHKLTQDRWRPEQISERAKLEGGIRVSTTTVYRHIARTGRLAVRCMSTCDGGSPTVGSRAGTPMAGGAFATAGTSASGRPRWTPGFALATWRWTPS